jgi:hypothetical protein
LKTGLFLSLSTPAPNRLFLAGSKPFAPAHILAPRDIRAREAKSRHSAPFPQSTHDRGRAVPKKLIQGTIDEIHPTLTKEAKRWKPRGAGSDRAQCDAITREAFARNIDCIDLRILCNYDRDFANPIEPSVHGGKNRKRHPEFCRSERGALRARHCALDGTGTPRAAALRRACARNSPRAAPGSVQHHQNDRRLDGRMDIRLEPGQRN